MTISGGGPDCIARRPPQYARARFATRLGFAAGAGENGLGWLNDLMVRLGGRRGDETLPLYRAIVARARAAHWYQAGAVPDTVDGRFDAVAAVLSTVLLRLEEDPAGAAPAALLTERFVDDMDGQLREIGIGDIVVGKHIGRMMSMLGGRLGAYRDGFARHDLTEALTRNLYRGQPPAPAALAHVVEALGALREALRTTATPALLEGHLP
jgi:cytochrome b pre-mRNA-processing protein 3